MELVEQAAALHAEAQELYTQLDLGTAFPWQPTLIGSARSGLMVTRDLDVMFDAPDATAPLVLEGLTKLARRVELISIDFADERGDRRPTSAITDERYYAVLHTANWKIDLTFWLHVVARPHAAHADRVAAATVEQRELILRLKSSSLESTAIYDAVLGS
ncbi:hypothetical protein HPO96_14930 [Kribbella sandramycini]|uniref:Nucleotidyltransferase-like protein n=1 Tax=Kribbella sandramycini TaxID=60450 RepID=A0A7Y4P0Y5_9ACTN|nr:hypothetical protein [Kribbella sandramycini]MBB6565270.1 hypothetical protein [Kribbella sandramycini]NOL41539.1 hypothetical protein [Kribbella sandramycini]